MKLPAAALAITALLSAQDTHHQQVDQRGDHVMGFSHEKTTHHFRLYADGGAIEVAANDSSDTKSRDEIRMHLTHIAKMFSAGDFQAPMLIHDTTPPGVPALQRLKDKVEYRYEVTDQGARIRIVTADSGARKAAHEFLRFQIADHRTGDSTAISKP